MKNHLKIIKNNVFSGKSCFLLKKKPPAGLHHTEDRAGNAPNPPFPIQTPKFPIKIHGIIGFWRSAAEAAACKLKSWKGCFSSIITSVTTLLALFSIFILGGEILRGFSFAMILGVLIGTYSSIFVASPILKYFKVSYKTIEKEEEKIVP